MMIAMFGSSPLLNRLPKILGYPHFFVLGQHGNFLTSEDTSQFERGRGYAPGRIVDFLRQWSPQDPPVKCERMMRGTDAFAPGFRFPWSSVTSHPELAM